MFKNLRPIYLKAVEARLAAIAHEGTVADSEEHLRVTSQVGNVQLSVVLESRGKIVQAKHRGATGATRAILDTLCEFAVNRPVRELSEHGLIYVEHSLREPGVAHPIPGLVTPENAGEDFHIPLRLVRDAYAQFKAVNGPEKQKNFWTPKPPDQWLDLSDLSRFKAIQVELLKIVSELKVEGSVEIVQVLNATRVILAVKEAATGPKFGETMIKVEGLLNLRLKVELELLLESVEDRNKRLDRTTIDRTTPTVSL